MSTSEDHAAGATRSLDQYLLPPHMRRNWLPYLWLFWLLNFFQKWFVVPMEPVDSPASGPAAVFLPLYFNGYWFPWRVVPSEAVELALALCTVAVFLPLYFNGYWRAGHRLLVTVVGCLLIGIVWLPFNAGAMTFFAYGSAFVGRAAPPRQAFTYLAGITLLLASELLLLAAPREQLLFGPPVCLVVGAATLHFAEMRRRDSALKLSQAEVQHLAAVAERERIARDLHDLLGHTLSVISIKAQLAARLAGRGDERTEQEIRDVESVSRDALRHVREAVRGFRRVSLDGELANAHLACEAKGIEFDVDRSALDLPADLEAVLAMCLREAITNVVRHSEASRCRASLTREGSWIRLTVSDDGRNRAIREGAGLAGMRERIEHAGGKMTVDSARGVALTIRVPVGTGTAPAEAPASGREAA